MAWKKKYIQTMYLITGYCPKWMRKPYNSEVEEKEKTQLKMGKELEKPFLQEDIQIDKRLMKDAQHH